MTLRIISVNDVYALDNLPKLKSLIVHYRNAFPDDTTLVIHAGDFLSPSLLSSIDAGRGMVDCLNAVGFTHMIIGNHEDDLEPADLYARLAELQPKILWSNLRSQTTPSFPRNDMVVADGRKVGLVGVVMADTSVYRGPPFGAVELVRANDAVIEEATNLRAQGAEGVIAITHQAIADDRALAGTLQLLVIIGGHEHTPMLVQENNTWIVKAGAEATQAAITEITTDGKVSVRLEDVAPYPEDLALRARINSHLTRVRELETATLLYITPGSEPLSSVGTRVQQTTIGSLICSKIRDALHAEACLFNGGGIRASKTYKERFTYGDVEAEVPFDNEVVVVPMKGAVVRDIIAASRASAPLESGRFLQVDDRCFVDASHILREIDGAAVDLDRTYSIAIVRELLLGLDRVVPLVRWAEENPSLVPPAGSGREPKIILVQAFALAIWRSLGGFDALDTDGDDRVTASEIAAAVSRAHPSQGPSGVLADIVVQAIDHDADRVITREDAKRYEDD